MVVSPQPRRIPHRNASQGLDHRIQIPRTEPVVHFRNQIRHLGHVPLGKTSEDNYPADLAGLLAGRGGKDGLDGFLLGVSDESAGVDQKHIDGTALLLRQDLP